MGAQRGHVFSLTTILCIPSHGQRRTTARSPYSSPPRPQPARLLGEQRAVQETKKRTKSHTACSTPKRDEGRESSAEDNREPLPESRMRSGYPLSPHPSSTILVMLTRTTRQEKEVRGTRMGKEKDTHCSQAIHCVHGKPKTIYQ